MKFPLKMILCLLSLWLASASLIAAPIDEGKAAFSSGDYAKASKLLSKAVKKIKDNGEKADAYAMIGAATVKLGKAGKGKAKFVKALKLNPNVSLPSEVADDKKVKKAFAAAQKKSGTKVSDGGSGKGSDSLTKTSGGRADHSAGNLKNYLPFGLNSFMQGKTLSAVAYGGSQAFGLLLYLNRKQAVSDANKDATSVIADAKANDAEDTEEFITFLNQNEAFVKKANSESTIALMVFLGGYAISVVDSIFDPFGTSKVASLDSDSKNRYANLGSEGTSRLQDKAWKFDLEVLPTRDPTLFVTMKKTF